jgi:acyl transferase domain-containing protein
MTLDELKNSRTAVFEVSMSDDYAKMHAKDPDRTPVTATTGNANCIRANRVSWHFGLLGPSVHVDTACSSSLIAMDLACQPIHSGDADAVC